MQPSTAAATVTAIVAALCLFAGASAQRGNFVDEGAFDYADQPPQRAAPRPAPAYRPNSAQSAAAQPKPTPVPILKQINRHNEDGSYTYGYEGADGAFKIETKLANGEVMGKYGYVDDSGKVRVIEYGANKYGFQPAGEGITVAPPTLVDETTSKAKGGVVSNEPLEYEDVYEEAPVRAAPAPRPVARPAPRPVPRPAPRPAPQPQPQPQYQPQESFPSFQSSQNFGPSRPTQNFAPSPSQNFAPSRAGPSSSQGPAPPRIAIPGAVPVGPSPSFSQARAQPVSRPAPRPAPQQSYFSPAPVYEPQSFAPAPTPAQQPSRTPYGRSSGILDQLEKDFALPSNGSPALHDITFGSF